MAPRIDALLALLKDRPDKTQVRLALLRAKWYHLASEKDISEALAQEIREKEGL